MAPPDRVFIPDTVRNQHIYVPGKTRHGKSTLFHALAYQDIKNGQGVCVIDPKGDLVSSLVHWIPESRKDDCVYIDPDNPVPIDILDYANAREKQTLVGELKYVITKGVNVEHAPLMNSILNDVIYTLLDANENGLDPPATFLDVHDFLAVDHRRAKILKHVASPRHKERWLTMPSPKECMPTLTRMNDYVNSDYLTKVFGCPKPTLNIARAMDERKILLVNLGCIDEPTKIFATMLIAKIRQAAFRRNKVSQSARVPFHLYVDEFEFFQTQDFSQILSFAGGYGLHLTLANQFITQLDPEIRDSIFGNVGSFIIFNVSPKDAQAYKHIAWTRNRLDMQEPVDLANMPKYRALFKIGGKDPIVRDTPAPPTGPPRNSRADYIKKRTLARYSCKSEDVRDNPSSDTTSDKNADDAPQKQKGRPPAPPLGTKQGNNPGPRR